MENLWPTLDAKEISGPLTILKEQGQYLQRMTKGVLKYDIDSKIGKAIKPSQISVRIDFYIHAPFLDDYKFLLFYITHAFIEMYPLKIVYIKTEKRISMTVKDDEEFKTTLKELLGSEYTINVLKGLLRQIQK